MPRRRVLMATVNQWHSPFQVGSHHLARGFAEAGWEVGFVSEPISPWHLLGGNAEEFKDRYHLYRSGGARVVPGKVWAYVPGALFTPHNKPVLNQPWIAEQWSRLTMPNLVGTLRQQGFGEVDVLYCDSVVHQGWLKHIRAGKSVYRIADALSGFAKTTPAIVQLERMVARSVDLVVYAAHSLEGYVKALRPTSMAYLPNAVNYAHFSAATRECPQDYSGIPRPIAVYVGAMDVWFDYRLMDEVLDRLPHVSFVLIGPDELARQRLRPRPNLHLLGRRPYADVPAYLQHADVGLIPFDVVNHAELVNSIHPLKLYEYAACGLPIVATEWEELTHLKSPAQLCRGTEAFSRAIEQALASPPARTALQAYAADHDWSARVSSLLKALGVPAE
ncbi:glycosyltransferase family protein [Nitrospira defluvii]|uniref:Glycosyl transferase n=1 Tax=Nitrospira defluvii TaxID=330214 RepID=A0ABM8SCR1_9BACT|nr:glycosyltransferase [Nitrospira defluvii]CAE6801669.1 Glycosyl transferase [Nitrospira defluvii]